MPTNSDDSLYRAGSKKKDFVTVNKAPIAIEKALKGK
jgi:hypothetical protein